MVGAQTLDHEDHRAGSQAWRVLNRNIVFTNAFTVGWIPQTPFMVGSFTFSPEGEGTRYQAGARHWDEAANKTHEMMGFIEGWGTVARQLADLAEATHQSFG